MQLVQTEVFSSGEPLTGAAVSAQRLGIVALAPNPWDRIWMNRQRLLSRLARRHAIVYSNGVWHRWQRAQPAYAAAPALGRFDPLDGVQVDRPPRWLLRAPRVPLLDATACRLAALRWRRALADRSGALVAYLFHPAFAPYVEALAPDRVVYHAYDLFRDMPGTTAADIAQEDALLRRADLVIATSPGTAADFKARGRRDVHVLRNGVEWSRFEAPAPAAPPDCLRDVPWPRVGYVGALNPKVDVDLLHDLARREPGWHFVLAGAEANVQPHDRLMLDALRALPNVHFTGEIAQDTVPHLLAHLDVGLVCYRTDGWARACDPLKLYEYLAAGLPVVASRLPALGALERAGLVASAATGDEWHAAIAQALLGHQAAAREARRATARANSWDRRAADLADLLDTLQAPLPATLEPAAVGR